MKMRIDTELIDVFDETDDWRNRSLSALNDDRAHDAGRARWSRWIWLAARRGNVGILYRPLVYGVQDIEN